jgi:serine/threonine protein kinase
VIERDRNLLFGIFAVQLRKVTAVQLIDAAAAWAADPTRDVPERLVNAGAMSAADCDLVNGFVEHAVQAHGNDPVATLAAFGGEEQVDRTYRGTLTLTPAGGVSVSSEPTVLSNESFDEIPGIQESPGRYTHVSEHARGGMGRVLLVHDQHLSRDIALKELLPDFSGQSASDAPSPVRASVPFVARFLQEARITGQLEHPSIVPVYELGHRKDGALYYTMKLVRGKTLSRAIKEATTLAGRLKLLPHFLDLCQAIAYAHSRGIIHRDIKPANVMVGEFGETVVLDWGLAKARGKEDVHADGLAETLRAMNEGGDADVAKTAYGQALGTPAYMPPEQARGQIDRIDERSDVYSLGAVLYELMTGEPPFTGKSVQEILGKVLTAHATTALQRVPDAPAELAAISHRAISSDPEKRYQSAKDLADEVERFTAGALVHAFDYGFKDYFRRFLAKNKTSLLMGSAAIVLIALVAGTAIHQIRTDRQRARQAAAEEKEAARLAAEAEKERAEKLAREQMQWRMTELQRDLLRKGEEADRELGRIEQSFGEQNIDDLMKVPITVNDFSFEGETLNGIAGVQVAKMARDSFMARLLYVPRFMVPYSSEFADTAADATIAFNGSRMVVSITVTDLPTHAVVAGPFQESIDDINFDTWTETLAGIIADALAKPLVVQTANAFQIASGKIDGVEGEKIFVRQLEGRGSVQMTRLFVFIQRETIRDDITNEILSTGALQPIAYLRPDTSDPNVFRISTAINFKPDISLLKTGTKWVTR